MARRGCDLTFKLQGPFLVGIEQFGIVQQVADQSRFAVVDTAAGDEFNKPFSFLSIRSTPLSFCVPCCRPLRYR